MFLRDGGKTKGRGRAAGPSWESRGQYLTPSTSRCRETEPGLSVERSCTDENVEKYKKGGESRRQVGRQTVSVSCNTWVARCCERNLLL